VDPSGFLEAPIIVPELVIRGDAPQPPAWPPVGPPPPPVGPPPPPVKTGPDPKPDPDLSQAIAAGATRPPNDTGTLGNTSGYVPQPVTSEPTDWLQHPAAQLGGGFVGGVALGLVPFGGVGQQLLDAAEALPHGTPEARLGLAFGQIVGGFVGLLGGLTGEVGGGIASTTGVGAAVGVPVIAVSTAVVVGSVGNMAAGIRGLMTTGSGNGGGKPTTLEPGASAGKSIPARSSDRDFTKAERDRINEIGRDSGCHTCGTKDPGTKSGDFIPDHQPPSKLAPGQPQRLYPHCRSCSVRQGGQVNGELYRK
jgi:hypothetical protein